MRNGNFDPQASFDSIEAQITNGNPQEDLKPKKTTIIFSPEAQRNANFLSETQGGISTTEAVHRAMRLETELREWRRSGGEVVLRHSGEEFILPSPSKIDASSVE